MDESFTSPLHKCQEIIKEMSDIDVVGMDSLRRSDRVTSMGYRPSSPLPEPERADCSWIWSRSCLAMAGAVLGEEYGM